jgi:hypothetical protein
MTIDVPFGRSLRYVDIMRSHREYFYHPLKEIECWPWYSILATPMPIREEILAQYTETYKAGRVFIGRTAPYIPNQADLPNIVELTAWWVAYLSNFKGYLGRDGMMTPSSTPFHNQYLCVTFMGKGALAARTNLRTHAIEPVPFEIRQMFRT